LEIVIGNEVENRLTKKLFTNYNKNVRPIHNKSMPVNMTFGIAYVQLV